MIAQRRAAIVTDRPESLADLRSALLGAGYVAEIVATLEATSRPDLALIDLRSGHHWSTAKRAEGVRRLLLVGDAKEFKRAFELGADDCVLADAHPDEVAARCDAVLRRTGRQPSLRPDAVVFVDRRLWINFDSRQVWVAGAPVHLTPREFRLLRFLIQHRDERLGHARILEAVWERKAEGERPSEVLKQYIWRLRQKLEDDPDQPTTIVTDAGEGYRFIAHPA